MRFSTVVFPFFLLSCFFLLSLPTSTNALEANVCVSVMLNLGAALGLTGTVRATLAKLGVKLNIRICLCLSAGLTETQQRQAVEAYISGIPGIGAIIELSSRGAVVDAVLQVYLGQISSGKQCDTPDHGHPICAADGTCGVQCDTNFVYQGNKCKCKLPFHLCGDVCSTNICPTGGMGPGRRSLLRGRERCTRRGHTFCPVQGSEMGMASGGKVMWECLSTDEGLESCGGCPFKSSLIAPLVLASSSGASLPFKLGSDCSAIPFVDSVRCSAGKCLVETCTTGWQVTEGRDGCENANRTQRFGLLA